MTGRWLLILLVSALPWSIHVGAVANSADSRSARGDGDGHETRVTVVGNSAHYAIIERGCQGVVLNRAEAQLRSGALEIEHVFPNDFVLGVRGSTVTERLGPQERPDWPDHREGVTNVHVFNPYLGWCGDEAEGGVGWRFSDHDFVSRSDDFGRAGPTAHFTVFHDRSWATFRVGEDMPYASVGHRTWELGAHLTDRLDATGMLGYGPWDGLMLGLEGRVWVTPEAALLIRGGTTWTPGEHTLGAGLQARFGRH